MRTVALVLALPLALATAACPAEPREADPTPAEPPAEPTGSLEAARAKAFTPTEAPGTREDDLALPPGTRVPDWSVRTVEGEPFTSADLTKDGPALLVFYRGGWCPYCSFQIRELAQRHDDLKKAGVTPVAVSVDVPEAATLTKRTYEVPFPLLSDPDLKAHEAMNVVLALDEKGVERLEGFGIEIEKWSKRDHHRMAVPAVFIVDENGVVRWAHVARDYKTRPTVDQLLEVIPGALADEG